MLQNTLYNWKVLVENTVGAKIKKKKTILSENVLRANGNTYKESILGCPPPIILIFGYVIEDRKIRNTCFFIFPPFSYLGGWKLRSKLGLENHFCGKKWTFWKSGESVIFSHSKTQNSFIDTIPLSLIILEIFHKNDF